MCVCVFARKCVSILLPLHYSHFDFDPNLDLYPCCFNLFLFQSQVVGVCGVIGARAHNHAKEGHKHACATVIIQLLKMAAPVVMELIMRHNHATQ